MHLTIECGFTLKRVPDMTRTFSQMHRTEVLRTELNYLASLAKWFSVRLRTKRFWVRIQFSDFAPASSKEFLDIQATIECESVDSL